MTHVNAQLDAFFSGLVPEERQRLFAGEGLWQKCVFKKGDMVFQEGTKTTDLYLILEGRVAIEKKLGAGGRRKVLAILDPGAIFGEGALLSDKPRSASAVARTDLMLLKLEKSQFDAFLKENPMDAHHFLMGLLKVVNQRLMGTNQQLITLYELTHFIREFEGPLPDLVQGISEKLQSVVPGTVGVIALENRLTQREDVVSSWGGLSISTDELERFEADLKLEQSIYFTIAEGKRLVLAIRDFSGSFLGLVVMDAQHEWLPEQKKLVQTIIEQLGMAVADLENVESEVGRERLSQQSISF